MPRWDTRYLAGILGFKSLVFNQNVAENFKSHAMISTVLLPW